MFSIMMISQYLKAAFQLSKAPLSWRYGPKASPFKQHPFRIWRKATHGFQAAHLGSLQLLQRVRTHGICICLFACLSDCRQLCCKPAKLCGGDLSNASCMESQLQADQPWAAARYKAIGPLLEVQQQPGGWARGEGVNLPGILDMGL